MVLVGEEQFAQNLGQRVLLFVTEGREQGAFVVQVQRGDPVDEQDALAGELDKHSAGVSGVGGAPDESLVLEPVQAVGHRAGAAHETNVELGRREAVRGPGAAEAGQYVPARSR